MIKLAAFDFDGTLADSVDFCLELFNRVFKKYMGDKAPGLEDIYQCFGMNEPGIIRHFTGGYVPEAENDFYCWHRELHKEFCPDVYPGCRELLEYLKARNIKMAIITGRAETTCQISMEVLDLKEYFDDFQYGSPEKNDKTAQLLSLADKYDLRPDEVIYIGDAVSDVQASQRAGVKCLAAAWAKSARIAELEKLNPGLVFTEVAAMQRYIADCL